MTQYCSDLKVMMSMPYFSQSGLARPPPTTLLAKITIG